MQAVAEAVGIRAPSLYKRFPDRAGLLAAVELEVLSDLERMLVRAVRGRTADDGLEALAHAYRRYARANPHLYALLFSGATLDEEAARLARQRAAQPAIDLFASQLPREAALAAARVATAYLHGFVTMENAREFRLGPGIDEAFALGLRTLGAGLFDAARRPARR